ncbi:MAG: xanthine dehydrogenase family protein subunit M [Rhodospirillales bacterium]|nr:xanthine dehydrogenase family protein subunit M [Rhodospirillales bacterium]
MTYLRRLPKFDFVSPNSLSELCSLTASAPSGEMMLFAGGTDAILQLRRREATPRCVIGLKRVSELDFIEERADGGLSIGAMTTLQTLMSSPVIQRHYDVLSETAAQIGGVELRNVATVGGNIAGALPCADLPPPLMTLGAQAKLSSQKGERWIPLEDFFVGFGQTATAEGEVLSEISLARPASESAGVYLKFHDRQSMDMTVVGVGAFVELDPDHNLFRDIRLAYAGSAPSVFRARQAELVLRGNALTEEGLDAAAEAAGKEANPRANSWRADPEYRLELIKNLTKRAIRRAWEKAVARGKANL